MSLDQAILNFIVIVLGLIFFYLIKNFLPTYFGEKGKNQATKEDVGEITEIVEKIKSDLLQQNELLKAQLSVSNQHKINIKNAERDALFQYNKRISAWIYSLMRFSVSSYNIDNYKELKKVSSDLAKRLYECDLAEAHIILFMSDKEFVELKKDLNLSVITLEGIINTLMHEIYYAYSKAEFEIEVAKNDYTKQAVARTALYNEIKESAKKNHDNRNKQYEKVHNLHYQMMQLINSRLKLLEDKEQ